MLEIPEIGDNNFLKIPSQFPQYFIEIYPKYFQNFSSVLLQVLEVPKKRCHILNNISVKLPPSFTIISSKFSKYQVFQ